jgi:2-oxoisovalerate dehydrogenase E1 component
MDTNQQAILLGEDICDSFGGCFKVTQGFSTKYPDRVLNTPISEAAITGVSTGLALRGYHPILEIMFYDFLPLAMDQLLNHVLKFQYLWGVNPQIMIRTVIGKKEYGVSHSQDLDYLFERIMPVYHPSLSDDVYEMMLECFKRDGPCLFVEESQLYKEKLV